jgi:hypothetical protein
MWSDRLRASVIGLWVSSALFGSALSVYGQATPPKPAIESYEDYSQAMKEIATLNGLLRKTVDTPSFSGVPAAAARLEVLFKGIQGYWENKKSEDAVAQTKSAVAALQAISAAASANDATAAAAAVQQLSATCVACHKVHRDRLTFDFYRIK